MFFNLTLTAYAQVVTALALVAMCPAVWMAAVVQLREHACRQHLRERAFLDAEGERARLPEPSVN